MYFIFSKLLLFLILPFYWVLALLVAALISKDKKRKQRLLIGAVVVLYLFTIPYPLAWFAKAWDMRSYPPQNAGPYSCVIVLGGFSSADKTIGGHFNASADRFIQAVKLLNTKKATHILISGGNGNLAPGQFREAAWVKAQLKDFNIPDSVILVENNSKNTVENAKFSKGLLAKAHLSPPYLLVTSAFHMRRSAMIFKKAGMLVAPYPSNFIVGEAGFFPGNFIPNAEVLAGWGYYTKEVVGYAVNSIK
jgi:uncharacterized SAM-binding protein YcdF (DUF218 family)